MSLFRLQRVEAGMQLDIQRDGDCFPMDMYSENHLPEEEKSIKLITSDTMSLMYSY